MRQDDPKMQGMEGLAEYLELHLAVMREDVEIQPLTGGYSNLTYLIKLTSGEELILRRPPLGLKISKAHDMVREFQLLKALQSAGFTKIPKPVLCCENEAVIGAPFFLMEKVEGLILRNSLPKGKNPEKSFFRDLSKNTIDGLLELHQVELKSSGLEGLGKPEGYIERQVLGWSDRYIKSKTDEIAAMETVGNWLKNHIPAKSEISLIHNDFKYDNLVINPSGPPDIKAILDWEMATIGDPLMDLGTTLAYWAEAGDADVLKNFNLTHSDGNWTRNEVISYYSQHSSIDLSEILFYYAFGLFKVAVIAQQIYKRHTLGFAPDPRFKALILVVYACSEKARKSIETGKI
jgi:aminoglycoside phosphotransferase (APT) family kinase protein